MFFEKYSCSNNWTRYSTVVRKSPRIEISFKAKTMFLNKQSRYYTVNSFIDHTKNNSLNTLLSIIYYLKWQYTMYFPHSLEFPPELQHRSIQWKELYPNGLTCLLWGDQWSERSSLSLRQSISGGHLSIRLFLTKA